MANSPMPRVTVVTPFFNGKQYLRECVESVLRQTHDNFEYLLIDNHSTDGASELARELAARDPRVRVVVPPMFLPQVENYNFAIGQAAPSSTFIKVVASDDWLFPTCLSQMVELAAAHPSVAVVSSYRLRGNVVDGNGVDPSHPVMSGRDACRLHLLRGLFLFGSPSSVMYRVDAVRERDPFYDPSQHHPDTEAVFEMLVKRDFGFVPQVLSFSRTQADSEMGSRRAFGPEALDHLLMVAKYGPIYLEQDELTRVLGTASRWHYSILAKAWLAGKVGRAPKNFWEYHRKGLYSIGKQVEPTLVAAALARLAVRSALSPLDTAKALLETLRAPKTQ